MKARFGEVFAAPKHSAKRPACVGSPVSASVSRLQCLSLKRNKGGSERDKEKKKQLGNEIALQLPSISAEIYVGAVHLLCNRGDWNLTEASVHRQFIVGSPSQ